MISNYPLTRKIWSARKQWTVHKRMEPWDCPGSDNFGIARYRSIYNVVRGLTHLIRLFKKQVSKLAYSHSIIKAFASLSPVYRSLFQFVEMTPIIKISSEIAGSNLGHGFSGHPSHSPGSRWVTASCEREPMVLSGLYGQREGGVEGFLQTSPRFLVSQLQSRSTR